MNGLQLGHKIITTLDDKFYLTLQIEIDQELVIQPDHKRNQYPRYIEVYIFIHPITKMMTMDIAIKDPIVDPEYRQLMHDEIKKIVKAHLSKIHDLTDEIENSVL